MNTYCPHGHRVTYSTLKPSKCPTCGTPMEAQSVAAAIAAITVPAQAPVSAPVAAPAAPARQPWPGREPREPSDDLPPEFTFDTASIRVASTDRVMTVGELRESGTPIERSHDSSDVSRRLVEEAIRMGAGETATAAATTSAKRPARKRTRAKGGAR